MIESVPGHSRPHAVARRGRRSGAPAAPRRVPAAAGRGRGGDSSAAVRSARHGEDHPRAPVGRRRRDRRGRQTVLFIDEVHRSSRPQQDALLGAVEDRLVLLVAATTENPSFSVVSPLLSRLLVLQLQSLTGDEVRELLRRAVKDERGLDGAVSLDPEAEAALVRLAVGDARSALTALEASADGVTDTGGTLVDVPAVERAVAETTVRYDRQGDQHHVVVSAFIKSIRGSDPDAALHCLARMLVAGEGPRFIARRLAVHASEDVGPADPTALQAAVAAARTVQLIGMPEARLALAQAQATVHLAVAPKSNTVILGIDEAVSDVRAGAVGEIPAHLRHGRHTGAGELGNAIGYRYPHRVPEGILEQQYPPDDLVGKDYHRSTRHGGERVPPRPRLAPPLPVPGSDRPRRRSARCAGERAAQTYHSLDRANPGPARITGAARTHTLHE